MPAPAEQRDTRGRSAPHAGPARLEAATGRFLSGLALLLLASAGAVQAQDPMAQPARALPLVERAMLLDGDLAGGVMVAVGEFGIALRSEDTGRSWTQGHVPVRSTLTSVHLHDAELGWAVGHDAAILRTRDGGQTWELLQYLPEEETPLLDVWFADESRGIALGAYGYYYTTDDGGDTWEQLDFIAPDYAGAADAGETEGEDEPAEGADAAEGFDVHEEVIWDDVEGPLDFHMNEITAGPGGRLYIAGEAGHLFRSDDGGDSWVSMPTPYEGSFFGVLPLDEQALLVYGLRGHLFRSDDGGLTWTAIETGTTALLGDATRLANGDILVAGLAGVLLESADGGRSFRLRQQPDRMGHWSILPGGEDALVLFGQGGVRRRSLDELGDVP